ncbi:hypothetical protein GCM10009804_34160 [Kribbella hippodromi]|uniref:Pyrroline-5-carboxylate reductase catalytic N-terminal domain-containing protein n=1 Tax=Kribbella hippodromi TaxID=434347 RepID=A0ABN2DCZ4_9ACTN
MRIGTLGNGQMATALATHWIAAGHDVMIGGRDPRRAAEVADQFGAKAGSLEEAAAYRDVVLLAVPADAALDVAEAVPADAALDVAKAVPATLPSTSPKPCQPAVP